MVNQGSGYTALINILFADMDFQSGEGKNIRSLEPYTGGNRVKVFACLFVSFTMSADF